ncbi:MAG: methyltransferase domain-containing protein [archaeon YNP-WB-062]|nr:methyltransferase domain-containing protein [Candidatus Culexarchaeum yellowstonense]
MKLNLGCGDDVKAGYINVDIRKTKPNVLMLDLEKDLLKVFPDNSVEEIIAKDVIEHVSWRRVEDLLRDIHRVLKSNGRIYIQVPDLEAIAKKVILNPNFKYGELSGYKAISYWIYGGQDYEYNFHKSGFTISTLRGILEQIGFIVEDIKNDGGSNIVCWARKP